MGELVPSDGTPPELETEVADLRAFIRPLFERLGTSLTRYAARCNRDKGAVSRYLNGGRIPPREFIDDLLRHVAEVQGRPVTADVRAEAHRLRGEALRVRNVRAHEVETLRDQLGEAERDLRLARVRERALLEVLESREQETRLVQEKFEETELAWADSRHQAEIELADLARSRAGLRDRLSALEDELEALKVELIRAQELKEAAELRCQAVERQLLDAEASLAAARAEFTGRGGPDDKAIASWRDAWLREATESLQRSMMPELPPNLPGIEIAHRYLPASGPLPAGGDWFDTIPLGGCRVALVMGEVMGRGLQAVTAMGRLRAAVHLLAPMELTPSQILYQLDEVTQRLGEEVIATCLFAVYDPLDRVCTFASAGHMPPLLADGRGPTRALEVPPGPPIGIGLSVFEDVEVRLADNAQLVLFTSGLIKQRDRDLEDGFRMLCGSSIGVDDAPYEVLSAVLAAMGPGSDRDDASLLVARLIGIPADRMVSAALSATDLRGASRARSLVREAVSQWGLEEHAHTVELVTSELVTNALVHTRGPVRLRLVRTDRLLVEVYDSDHRVPKMLAHHDPALPDEMRAVGRGLLVVARVANRWGSRPAGDGKVVWCELSLRSAFL